MKRNSFCIKKTRPCFLKLVRFVIVISFLLTPFQGNAAWNPNQKLPVSVKMLLREVKELMNQKDYQSAIAKIIAFHSRESASGNPLSINPFKAAPCRHPMVCFALGNCYLLESDYQNAKTAYLKALENAPDFIDTNLNLAKVYSETKKFQEASDCFLKAYNGSDPKNPDYIYYSAVACLMGDKHEQAIAKFEKLFQAHPESIVLEWQENYANALMVTGRMEQAIPVIRHLVAQTSGDERIRWQETLLHIYLQNNTEQALSYATKLSQANCIVARWWKALVHIHLTLGQYNLALADLMIYGYLKPLSTKEKTLMADLCLQLEIPDKAARVYEMLLNEEPDEQAYKKPNKQSGKQSDKQADKQMLQRLVSAYLQLDTPEKALALIDRLRPEDVDPELLMLKGDLMYAVKRFNNAMAAMAQIERTNQM